MESEKDVPVEVSSIIANFDFERVRKTMIALNWVWRNDKEPPSLEQMENCAEKILVDAFYDNRNVTIGCGGFHATKGDNGFLELDFRVASMDANYALLID